MLTSARDPRQAGLLRQEDAEGDEGPGHGRQGPGEGDRVAVRDRHGTDHELLPGAVWWHARRLA